MSSPLRYVHVYASGKAKRFRPFKRAVRRVLMSPARAGSFNANFSPETLESFKSLCRDQSKQYTKVLERLAELYLGSQGQILDNLSESPELELNRDSVDLEKLKQSVEQLETMTSIHQEDFNELVNQMQELTGRIKKLESRLDSI